MLQTDCSLFCWWHRRQAQFSLMFHIFSGPAVLAEVAGHLDRMMKSVLSLTNMCECELVTSVSMFDVSCTPCVACQQYKYCMSRAFCHSRGEVGQHLLFFIQPKRLVGQHLLFFKQPKRLSSAVTHRYKFRKGMALILHWVGLEKT